MRAYERPIVAAILLLLLALLVLLPLARPSADARPPQRADAREPGASSGPNPARPQRASVREAPAGDHTGAPPTACAPDEDVRTLGSPLAAVAADGAGRLDFYGLPNPQTGLRGPDSYDYLRPCVSAELSVLHLNPVRISVSSPASAARSEPALLGPETVVAGTRRVNDALVTRFRLPGGLIATQSLELVRTEGRFASSEDPDTLRASYTVENPGAEPAAFDLSSVLAPAKGPHTNEFSGVPYLANHPPRGPGPAGAVAITKGAVLEAGGGELPEKIIVPRPGAAASSTAYWRLTGPPPDRLAFGSAVDLAQGPPVPARPGEKLSDTSAFSVLWDNVEVAPGAEATLSYEYGQTSGWPAP